MGRRKAKKMEAIKEETDDEDASDSTSDEREDEDGVLLTKHVENKIFETLIRIKQKAPEIYSKDHIAFNENDFEGVGEEDSDTNNKKNPMKYKDQIRETLLAEGADTFTREEEQQEKLATPRNLSYAEEQQKLKNDFMIAAKDDLDEEGDFFTKKTKTAFELKAEETAYNKFLSNNATIATGDSEEIIRRYWMDDEELSEKDKFLRDYILLEKWKRTDNEPVLSNETEDAEDQQEFEKAENFESAYNFRFEEGGGEQLNTYSRSVEGSVRRVNDKRRQRRLRKKELKHQIKAQKIEEIKRLKGKKRKEIIERLKKIQEISGVGDSVVDSIDLDEPFDSQKHDCAMSLVYGNDYYNAEESLSKKELLSSTSALEDALHGPLSNALQTKKQRKANNSAKKKPEVVDDGLPYAPFSEWDEAEDPSQSNTLDGRMVVDENELQETQEQLDENNDAADNDPWYLCDQCKRGIPGGSKRYDCTVCEDYILCVACYKSTQHPHSLKRKRVPENHQPPPEYLVPEGAKSIIDEFLEEYNELEYDDIMGDDTLMRFKYEKVKPLSYGLTTSDILNRTDAELNSIVPMKRLATYYPEEKSQKVKARTKQWFQGKRASGGNRDNQISSNNSWGRQKAKINMRDKGLSQKQNFKPRKSARLGISANRWNSYGLSKQNGVVNSA